MLLRRNQRRRRQQRLRIERLHRLRALRKNEAGQLQFTAVVLHNRRTHGCEMKWYENRHVPVSKDDQISHIVAQQFGECSSSWELLTASELAQCYSHHIWFRTVLWSKNLITHIAPGTIQQPHFNPLALFIPGRFQFHCTPHAKHAYVNELHICHSPPVLLYSSSSFCESYACFLCSFFVFLVCTFVHNAKVHCPFWRIEMAIKMWIIAQHDCYRAAP